jgi:hypothetical protein
MFPVANYERVQSDFNHIIKYKYHEFILYRVYSLVVQANSDEVNSQHMIVDNSVKNRIWIRGSTIHKSGAAW